MARDISLEYSPPQGNLLLSKSGLGWEVIGDQWSSRSHKCCIVSERLPQEASWNVSEEGSELKNCMSEQPLKARVASSSFQGHLVHFPAQVHPPPSPEKKKKRKRKRKKKAEKIHPEKNSLYLRKWNFLALIIRLHFLKKKLFLYLRKWNLTLFGLSSINNKNLPRESFCFCFTRCFIR